MSHAHGIYKKYKDMEKDSQVKRWYLNNRARSAISADIWRRDLGLYCSIQGITPDAILKQATDGSLKNSFSGLRPESLGSYEGDDGLTIGDIEDFNVESHSFSVISAKVNVRNNLSKARFRYFTFLSAEGVST